jgi:hypothetical protein
MYQKIIVVLLIIFLIFFISNDDKMNKYSQNKNFQYLFLIFMIFCLYNNVNVLFLIIIFLIFIYFNTNLRNKLKNNKLISNFYSGSLFETFIENFDDGTNNYEIKPYIQEENNNIKEESKEYIKEESKKNEYIKSESKESFNNSTPNDSKETIEPFKLNVEEIRELYNNIKLEINNLD